MCKPIVSSKYIRGLNTRIRQIARRGGSAKICPSDIVAPEAIRQQHLCFLEFPKQRTGRALTSTQDFNRDIDSSLQEFLGRGFLIIGRNNPMRRRNRRHELVRMPMTKLR
jgi:hypothetical protein